MHGGEVARKSSGLMMVRHRARRAGNPRQVLAALAAVLTLACSSGAAWAQADEARAKKIVSGVCFVCHGTEGESSSEMFPRLAGQHWEYTAKQLANFKSGKRKGTAMGEMVAKLTPDEMVAVGKYFEKMVVPREPAKEPDLAAVGKYIYHTGNKFSGVPACVGCHGPEALGTSSLPRLASPAGERGAVVGHREQDRGHAIRGPERGSWRSSPRALP